jgi:ethanolamine permease
VQTANEDAARSSATGLKRGSVTWRKAAALGVAIAISGSFAGWNYGLGAGGWGGMMIAALATGVLFFCLTQAVAELSAAMPTSAGFDSYVGATLGPVAGFLAGICVALGLALGTGLALSFTAAYTEGMFGVGGWPVKGALLAAGFLLHLRGAREATGLTMVVGAIALTALLLFSFALAPQVSVENLYTVSDSRSTLVANGWLGVIQSVPFALFMFLGVEQAAQAAAEVQNPARDMPRALLAAILITFAIGVAVLFIATGATGATELSGANDPLLAAVYHLQGAASPSALSHIVGGGALISFLATFFSLAYGSSRQFYHLAASGALPSWLARTNRHGAPAAALTLVAIIGAITASFSPDNAMVVFIFLLMITYELILVGFLRMRAVLPQSARAYHALGGRALGWVGAILGLAAILCCYQLQIAWLSYAFGVLALLLGYFLWRRRTITAAV